MRYLKPGSKGLLVAGIVGALLALAAAVPSRTTGAPPPASPSLVGRITSKSGPSNARVWAITLSNGGSGTANNAQIDSFSLSQTIGAACTPVVSSPATFPLAIGSIAPAGSALGTLTIDFTGCPLNARFSVTILFSANAGAVTGSIVRYQSFQ